MLLTAGQSPQPPQLDILTADLILLVSVISVKKLTFIEQCSYWSFVFQSLAFFSQILLLILDHASSGGSSEINKFYTYLNKSFVCLYCSDSFAKHAISVTLSCSALFSLMLQFLGCSFFFSQHSENSSAMLDVFIDAASKYIKQQTKNNPNGLIHLKGNGNNEECFLASSHAVLVTGFLCSMIWEKADTVGMDVYKILHVFHIFYHLWYRENFQK